MAPLISAMARWRRLCPWAALLLAAAALAGGPASALQAPSPMPLEQAIKASYITKFAPFIEWPAASFATAASPFTICIAGRDAFGSVLDEVARGQKVRGHPVQIRRISDAVPTGGCHILIMGVGSPETMLAQIAGQPVLTVTDKDTGGDAAMIRFVQLAGRVRFEIDNGAARTARLAISSKLLGLAVTVTK